MTALTGWFFLYRGNGYGPYQSWDVASEMFRMKHKCLPWSVVCPVYGTAYVENKRLMRFDRKISEETKGRYVTPTKKCKPLFFAEIVE